MDRKTNWGFYIRLIKKLFCKNSDDAEIIPEHKHRIAREHISPNAIKVLARLQQAGYQAYLVGGSVRDLLLGKIPKDFDVATDAKPEEVKNLFRNCRLIGRRFRLAHVFFGQEIIEVATFRTSHEHGNTDTGQTRNGLIVRDNVYGSLKEDAWRRDFRINALYYNIADNSLVDFTGGMQDIRKRRMTLIGNPQVRYQEDPVRILRAIRLANKLDLKIPNASAEPFYEGARLLIHVPPSRLFDELLKLLLTGSALKNFNDLRKFNLLKQLFPMTEAALNEDETFKRLVDIALKNTDDRIHSGKTITPVFILAIFLWKPIQKLMIHLKEHAKLSPMMAMEQAINTILKDQNKYVAIPRRLTHNMSIIWLMQMQFSRRHGNRAEHLLTQPRFRAGFDFLLLRAEAGEPIDKLANWWKKFSVAEADERTQMVAELPKPNRSRRRNKI